MPKAEVGSTKHLANKMKSKGLQRLRWYCQVCSKQCRDENGFKCHTLSESHVRAMQSVGADARSAIQDFSNQFQRDFLLQLRTAHGTKPILINHFYQEYIANKEHVHMNATKWPSLTEFAKHLGREGICRVDEQEKGLTVAWIDNSPEALRRQAAIQKRERQDKGDEEREQRLIRDQIARAQQLAAAEEEDELRADQATELKRENGEKISLSFGVKASTSSASSSESQQPQSQASPHNSPSTSNSTTDATSTNTTQTEAPVAKQPLSLSMKPSTASRPKNVFATAKSNKSQKDAPSTKSSTMSNAERIMREEMERQANKRKHVPTPAGTGIGFAFGGAAKKQRV